VPFPLQGSTAEELGPILHVLTAVPPGMLCPVAAVAEVAELPLPITILHRFNQNLLPKKPQQANCALAPLAINILKDPSFLGVSVRGAGSGISLPRRLASQSRKLSGSAMSNCSQANAAVSVGLLVGLG